MSTTLLNHPPDARPLELGQLETVLPRLTLVERIAMRIAVRGVLRLERFERDAALRRHALVLENERRMMAADHAAIIQNPLR